MIIVTCLRNHIKVELMKRPRVNLAATVRYKHTINPVTWYDTSSLQSRAQAFKRAIKRATQQPWYGLASLQLSVQPCYSRLSVQARD